MQKLMVSDAGKGRVLHQVAREQNGEGVGTNMNFLLLGNDAKDSTRKRCEKKF